MDTPKALAAREAAVTLSWEKGMLYILVVCTVNLFCLYLGKIIK